MIKHTRIQDSGGRWRIEFEPSKSGVYQIQTNDPATDDSPLILASMDILPGEYQRTIEGERIVHPNVLNFIHVNSSNDNLHIQLRRALIVADLQASVRSFQVPMVTKCPWKPNEMLTNGRSSSLSPR